jgi:hypothetical protein
MFAFMQAPPDLFFDLRAAVHADMHAFVFLHFTESPEFASLRQLSPRLLHAWRNRIGSHRVASRRVVVSSTPVVDAATTQIPCMFRPHGRVASHCIKLCGSNTDAARAELPHAPSASSLNEVHYMLTPSPDVVVDRGML